MLSNGKWSPVRLGDVVSIKHGWPFKSEFFSEELTGRPIVVAVGNFRYTGGFRFESTAVKEYRADYPRDYELKPGDTLLVMTCQTAGGEILGIPARIPDDGRTYLHNQRLGKVVVERPDCVDEDFLYWVFLWSEFNQELFATSSGTKIVHTAPSRIEAFRFDLPPLPEQRAIARILGALDDKIELNRQMNVTLEGMARALFKSWFVDFDPVTAKAAGRQPFGMSPDLAALFPDRFTDSPLGPIPEGWHVSTIGEAVRVVGGSTPSTNEPRYWEGGTIHWCTPRDLSRLVDPVVLDTERKITEAGLGRISSGLLPKGTVLLSSRAPIGYLAIAEVPLAVNQGFIAMICDKQLPNQYVLRWAEENMDEILSRAGGTTFAEISKRSFRPIPVLIPARPVLDAFVVRTDEWHEQVAENLRESTVIAQTRDALLPQLLSGEIRLRQAEKLVEEVA